MSDTIKSKKLKEQENMNLDWRKMNSNQNSFTGFLLLISQQEAQQVTANSENNLLNRN